MRLLKEGNREYLSTVFSGLALPDETIDAVVFEECSFDDCNFNQSAFTDCAFVECRFSKCDLSVVTLNRCRFNDVIFESCKIIGVDWTNAVWPTLPLFSPIKFYNCVIDDSSFFGLNLSEIVIEACTARDVDFREGDFSESNFTFSDLTNSLFNGTNLVGADFTEATNYRIDLNHNRIERAKFSRYEAVRLLESLPIELVD